MFNGRRQPSYGGTSRMMREYQVRICERLGVKLPGPTRHSRPGPAGRRSSHVRYAPKATFGHQNAIGRDGPSADIHKQNQQNKVGRPAETASKKEAARP